MRARWHDWSPSRTQLLELLVLGLILANFARVVVRLIGVDASLHWDEAVYATRARSWIDPEMEPVRWEIIRSPLLPLMAVLPILAGGEEWQLRTLGLLAGLGLIVLVWWLGRLTSGPVAGVAAAGVVASSPTLQVESAALLTDVPAAAMLLLLLSLLWRELELRKRPGAGLILVAILASVTFFLRYGASFAIAPIFLTAIAIWWRPLLAERRVTIAATAVGLAFLGLHFAWSVAATGTPLGILLHAQEVVLPYETRFTTFEQYVAFLPMAMAGPIGYYVMILGLVGVALALVPALVARGWGRHLRGVLLLVVPGAVYVSLLTGTMAHAESRYFIFPTAAFVVAGVATATAALRWFPLAIRTALIGVLAVALALSHPSVADHSFDRMQVLARYYGPFRTVGQVIGEVADPDCDILGGGGPIVAWYSRCNVVPLVIPDDGSSPTTMLKATDTWAVVFKPLDEIDPDVREAVRDHARDRPLRIHNPATGQEFAVAWPLAR